MNIALPWGPESAAAKFLEAPPAHLEHRSVEHVGGHVERGTVELGAVQADPALCEQAPCLRARQPERVRHHGGEVDLAVVGAEGELLDLIRQLMAHVDGVEAP